MAAAPNNNTHLGRFIDVGGEPRKLLQPIEGYQSLPLVSLEEAIEPILEFCPDVRRRAYISKGNCDQPKDNLTQDESASIHLYTSEWEPRDECLYVVLNSILRSQNRKKLIPPWLLFIKLLLTALFKLRSCTMAVWRAVPLDLRKEYEIGKTYTWWGFSSCTESIAVLQSEQFLGQEGKRTMFNIECFNGKKIRQHSSIEDEDEILLLPASQFVVKSHLQPSKKDPDLIIIHLQQVEPPFLLLEPPSKGALSSTYDSKKKVPAKEATYDVKQPKISAAAASSVESKASSTKTTASYPTYELPSKGAFVSTYDSNKKAPAKEATYDVKQPKISAAAASSAESKTSSTKTTASYPTYEPPSTTKKPEKVEIKSKNDQFAKPGTYKESDGIESSAM